MVTPAMQQQPPPVIYGPNGERAEWNGREYIVVPSAAPQAGPAAPQGIPGLIPMETPADRRAEEDRAYRRQRDAVVDTRAERQLAVTEQAAGLRGNPYQKKFDEARATRDANRFDEALSGRAEAAGLEAAGRRAERILEDGAPVGAFADQRIATGRVAGDWLGWLPGIPNREQTQQLEQLRLLGSQGALGDVSQLKGPLSEKELAFIQRLQIDPNATRETNMQVAEAMQWAARRQNAYGETMERWVMQYGSPSAPNEQGQSFGSWWGGYAAENLPFPDGSQAPAGGAVSGQGGVGGGIRPGQPVTPEIAARFGQDGRVTAEEMMAAGWQPDRETGQWLPPGGASGGSPPPAGPQGGGGGGGGDRMAEVSVGGAPQSEGYQTALEQERANSDLLRSKGIAYGDTDALTGEFNDELAYGAGFLRQGLGNLGRRLTGREIEVSAEERARAARDSTIQDRDRFAREEPGRNVVANVLGGGAFGPAGAARTMVGRMAQGGGIGATYGFAGAEGSVTDRLPSAAVGAGVGAAATPIVEKAVAPAVNALARPIGEFAQSSGRFVGRQIGNTGNALGVPGAQRLSASMQPNPLQSGMNRFADRMGPERVNALSPNLATARNNGLDEADLIDILDDGSIGRMRALGTRDTPARDVAVASAEARRRNLPSRVSRIASEEISQDSRPAIQAIDELGQSRRANASSIDTGPSGRVVGDLPVRGVAPAFRGPDGKIYTGTIGTQHFSAVTPASRAAGARDAGFVDPDGNFLSRTEALDYVRANGEQIRPSANMPGELDAMDYADQSAFARLGEMRPARGFGGDPVSVTPDVVQALRSDFVRPHIAAAARRAQGAVKAEDRAAAARLNNLVETSLDNPAGVQLTVREAQDVSRALNEAADAAFRSGSPDGPVLKELARTVRGAARNSSEGYAAWLTKYGDDSDLIEAATTGRNFVSVSKDPASARGTEAFVNRGQGASPPEQAIMRTAAREAVETAGSNPSGARTVLEGFANDTGQARRAAAIGADPRRLQERAGAELDSVTRHQRASPRIGSETNLNSEDSAGAAGAIIGAVRRPVSTAAEWAGNRLTSRGFSNQEAEAIVIAANDATQTEQLVSLLSQRMSRREARSLARMLRYQITTNPPTSQ